jgi:hypothetical protein
MVNIYASQGEGNKSYQTQTPSGTSVADGKMFQTINMEIET